MKKILTVIAVAVLMAATQVQAQIFYNAQFISLWGTNYAPVMNSYVLQTNPVYSSLVGRSLTVTNINTNEAITIAYGYQVMGQNTTTNPVIVSTFTTNFPASAGWTNGATWTFTVPPAAFYPAVVPWGEIGISNGQYVNYTCTNGVSFQ